MVKTIGILYKFHLGVFCFMWKHQSISFIISVLQMSSRHVHGIMHILEELIYPRCRKISILHKVGQMQADFCSMKMNITHSMTQLLNLEFQNDCHCVCHWRYLQGVLCNTLEPSWRATRYTQFWQEWLVSPYKYWFNCDGRRCFVFVYVDLLTSRGYIIPLALL